MNLILASGSAYRKLLLQRLGLKFDIESPGIDETPQPQEACDRLALRLSIEKAKALGPVHPNGFIIGSDQVAVLNGERLEKPGNRNCAVNQLTRMNGNVVVFYTGVCVFNQQTKRCLDALDICKVYFKPLTAQQIECYVDYEQPFDCAGSFKSEGLGIALMEKFEGEDPTALIGLPLIKLVKLLSECGIAVL